MKKRAEAVPVNANLKDAVCDGRKNPDMRPTALEPEVMSNTTGCSRDLGNT